MPDESDRIRATSIRAMNYMLFILNSFDVRADIGAHPRIILIFNDVSLYNDRDSIETIKEQKKVIEQKEKQIKDLEEKLKKEKDVSKHLHARRRARKRRSSAPPAR